MTFNVVLTGFKLIYFVHLTYVLEHTFPSFLSFSKVYALSTFAEISQRRGEWITQRSDMWSKYESGSIAFRCLTMASEDKEELQLLKKSSLYSGVDMQVC